MVNEEKKKEKQGTSNNSNERVQQEATSPIEEARKLREEIRMERELMTSERKRMEELRAEEMLSGTAGGGLGRPKTQEQMFEEAVKNMADEITNAFN